jgi:hypothetical protein
MEKLMPYKDLNHALKLFRAQVIESIPYAIENFPALSSPEKIFNYLKLRTTYKKDPPGTELFQTLQTLFDNNFHGIPGAGDCDCFTIAGLATLIANGFTDCGILLAGRNPFCAVHIYVYGNRNGKRYYFDLTNRTFDYERYYPYKQHIPFKLNQSEKNMMLQLADGGAAAVHPYIHFPNKRVQVREDYFDNMSAGEFQNMCLEEGVPLHQIEELSGRRAERKVARQENKTIKKNNKPRNQRKMIKAQTKAVKVQGKAQKNVDKGRAKVLKGQAKVQRANNPRPIPRAQMFTPQTIAPLSPYDNYDQPEVEDVDYEEVEGEEVEQTPEEEFEQEMAEMFEGEATVMGLTLKKGLLWGIGLTLAGIAVGKTVKHFKKRRRAA